MIQRRISKQVWVGGVPIGGGAPIVVQSMTTTDTRDVKATVRQIHELEEAGCEIVRVAVPDEQAAEALREIKRQIHIPLVADIHFDYRLALMAIDAGVDKLRLNPGNIRDPEKIKQVVRKAKERGIPIRVGVNAGSLPPAPIQIEAKRAGREVPHVPRTADRMVEAALWEIRILESLDFDQIVVSLKAFDVPTAIEAYTKLAEKVPYPFHVGITESGTPRTGTIRSAVGIGAILSRGIGDTIRVSLATDPVEEVFVAYEILKSLNLRQRGVTLVACPSCGRAEVDQLGLAAAVEEYLKKVKVPIKVAVMGCVVNGPGEASEADVGVAGGRGKGAIFRKGKVVKTVPEEEILPALLAEIEAIARERAAQGAPSPAD